MEILWNSINGKYYSFIIPSKGLLPWELCVLQLTTLTSKISLEIKKSVACIHMYGHTSSISSCYYNLQ